MLREHLVPIYEAHVIVCVAEDPHAELKGAGIPPGLSRSDSKTSVAWVHECPLPKERPEDTSAARWVVALRPHASLNTVMHECFHLLTFICAWHGLPMAVGYDEPAAYLMGWLAETLVSDLNAYRADAA